MPTGGFQADMGLLAAHRLEPGQHQLPALRSVREDLSLFSLTSRTVYIQRLLGNVDPNDGIIHSYDHYSGQVWRGSASGNLVRGVSGMPRPWIPFGMNSGA